MAVIFVDLDRFKVANDTLGHETGDALLQAAAERLSSTVRGSDTVARLGGDEFVIVAEDLKNPNEAVELAHADRRRRSTRRCPWWGRASRSPPAPAWPSPPPVTAARPEELVREADTAMYRAKGAGRDRFEVFDDIMRAEVADRVAIAQELRHALERDELVLEYQPMVGVSDGSLAACEALLRWHHPERGIVPPLAFIPLAEENGLIVPIGEWVLREACRQAAEWRRQGDQVPGDGERLARSSWWSPTSRPRWPRRAPTPACRPSSCGSSWWRPASSSRARRCSTTSASCATSACASPSTTSAPAPPRSPTSAPCRSTRSSSTAPSCAT